MSTPAVVPAPLKKGIVKQVKRNHNKTNEKNNKRIYFHYQKLKKKTRSNTYRVQHTYTGSIRFLIEFYMIVLIFESL